MLDPLIVVPWRGGAADRERAWAYLRPYYEQLGWPIVESDSGDEPFSRGNSQNQGAASQDWDVLLILDADCIVNLDAIRKAVDLAYTAGAVVLPHMSYVPMSYDETSAVYAGADPIELAQTLHQGGPARGGLHIIAREAWEKLGGYDPCLPRGQDTRLHKAAEAKGVPLLRTPGPIIHLYHSRPDKTGDPDAFAERIFEYIGKRVPVGSYKWLNAARKIKAQCDITS